MTYEANDKISSKSDLAELARESDKIRLKQAEEEKRHLPAAQEESVHEEAADRELGLLQTTKAKPNGRNKNSSRPGYPFAFFFALLFTAICGSVFLSLRTEMNGAIASFLRPVIGTPAYVLAQYDIYTRGEINNRTMTGLTNLVNALYTKQDTHAHTQAFVRLTLAEQYLRDGQTGQAKRLLQEAAAQVQGTSPETTKELTEKLFRMAERFETTDKPLARQLYLSALSIWNPYCGPGTVSNARSALAELDEELGNITEANELYRSALKYSLQWKDQNFNVYRYWKVGKTYNELGEYALARDYLLEGLRMSERLKNETDYLDELNEELDIATEHLKNKGPTPMHDKAGGK